MSGGTSEGVKNIKRVAAATIITTAGLGLAGLGAASVAEAFPGPFPDYHWCPGQYYHGEPHDQGHWHGPGPWHP